MSFINWIQLLIRKPGLYSSINFNSYISLLLSFLLSSLFYYHLSQGLRTMPALTTTHHQPKYIHHHHPPLAKIYPPPFHHHPPTAKIYPPSSTTTLQQPKYINHHPPQSKIYPSKKVFYKKILKVFYSEVNYEKHFD